VAFFAGTRPRLNLSIDGRSATYNEFAFGTQSLWDMQQVEVLRGPQSHVRGQNAVAGAVVMRSKDPTDEWEGTLRLGFLLKNNPFLEKEAAAALQYVGYTSPLNMSGNPAMSVPLYRHHGLPVGTQFAAAHGREDTLLRLAAQLEQIQPWAEIPQLA